MPALLVKAMGLWVGAAHIVADSPAFVSHGFHGENADKQDCLDRIALGSAGTRVSSGRARFVMCFWLCESWKTWVRIPRPTRFCLA